MGSHKDRESGSSKRLRPSKYVPVRVQRDESSATSREETVEGEEFGESGCDCGRTCRRCTGGLASAGTLTMAVYDGRALKMAPMRPAVFEPDEDTRRRVRDEDWSPNRQPSSCCLFFKMAACKTLEYGLVAGLTAVVFRKGNL